MALTEPDGCTWIQGVSLVSGSKIPVASMKKDFPAEWAAWNQARYRCHDPNGKQWANYGGRGITMAPEWFVSFDTFLEHIGPKPTKDHTLDRIDNERGYEPGNVRWATWTEQAANKRTRTEVATGMTKGQAKLAKANEVRRRAAHEKLAARLREAGWTCVPPKVTQ